MTHDDWLDDGRCPMTRDHTHTPTMPRRSRIGLLLALLTAAAFGTSGAFARSLIDAGWSPAAAVTARVCVAALVVGWLWARHRQRPRKLTIGGTVVSILGLALVLDLAGDTTVDVVGVLWGLVAAVGLAVFFVVSAKSDPELPPLVMAGGGMTVGAIALLALGAVGVLPLAANTDDVLFAGHDVPWWVPVAGLSLIAAVFSYVVGIMAARALGSKLSSFVGLTEVMFAVLFAWLLLGQLPTAVQLIGGALIVVGVAMVRVDELRADDAPTEPVVPSTAG